MFSPKKGAAGQQKIFSVFLDPQKTGLKLEQIAENMSKETRQTLRKSMAAADGEQPTKNSNTGAHDFKYLEILSSINLITYKYVSS